MTHIEKNPAIEDVDHEDVSGEQSLEQTITQEVGRFNKAEAGIAALKAQYGELAVKGLDDKEGYKAVKEAFQKVRSYRTGLEKKGLEIRGDYNKIVKAVSEEENRLVGLIEPLEEKLQKEVKRYDDLVDAEKKRLKEEADRQLNDRINSLVDQGMVFADGYYQLGGTISVDVATLRPMKEEAFQKLLAAVTAKAAELQEARDREDRLRQQREDELKEQQEQLRKQREDLEAEREKLRKEQEEAEQQKLDNRLLKFRALGMKQGAAFMTHDNGFAEYRVGILKIKEATDVELALLVDNAEAQIKENDASKLRVEQEKEAERKVLEQKKKLIASLLTSAGMTHDYNASVFRFYNPELALSYHMDKLTGKTEEELQTLATEVHDKIDTAKREHTRKENERQEKEKRERENQLTDADKMRQYLVTLQGKHVPEMSSAQYVERMKTLQTKLGKLIAEYLPLQEAAKA